MEPDDLRPADWIARTPWTQTTKICRSVCHTESILSSDMSHRELMSTSGGRIASYGERQADWTRPSLCSLRDTQSQRQNVASLPRLSACVLRTSYPGAESFKDSMQSPARRSAPTSPSSTCSATRRSPKFLNVCNVSIVLLLLLLPCSSPRPPSLRAVARRLLCGKQNRESKVSTWNDCCAGDSAALTHKRPPTSGESPSCEGPFFI